MQLAAKTYKQITQCRAQRSAHSAVRRPVAHVARAQWEENDFVEGAQPEPAGAKVQKWVATPYDFVAFGARAGMGALIRGFDGSLQTDVQRYMELLQDPRPLEDKAAVLLKEVEDIMVDCLEKGAIVESDIVNNVKTVLPPDVASVIDEIRPSPPNQQPFTEPMDMGMGPAPSSAPLVTYHQSDVQDSQIASEMTEIRAAVSALRAALDGVRTNTDIANTNMLRLTLKEARNILARRLEEVSPTTSSDATITAAAREARILLEEVDAQFF